MRFEPRIEGAGYFGKVPTHGDFVCARLDRPSLEALDAWLQASIRQSQAELGRDWLNAFLVAPIWRIALGAGICGPQPLLAVMMPSVDRVGRYFPLLIAARVPKAEIGIEDLIEASGWFDASEKLILSTLSEGFSLAGFDATAARLALPSAMLDAPVEEPLHALWWTASTESSPALAFTAPALPPPAAFSHFLTGRLDSALAERGTVIELLATPAGHAHEHPTDGMPADAAYPAAAPPSRGPVHIEAAAASLQGTRARHNADAWTITLDNQLLAVVSGIGDRPESVIAGRIVADALAEVEAPFSMNDLVAETKGKLGKAHTLIRARATGAAEPAAATVATLLVQARRYTVVWAGAARCLLLRGGTLQRLSRDHVETRLPLLLTRVVGGAQQLAPDTAIGQVEPGDRFLLCTQGLHVALPEADIAATLGNAATPAAAAQALAQDALIAGADFNCTAIAVFVEDAASATHPSPSVASA